ncbi:hypothetical protein [Vulcanimicrobium alpinum]|nr:hypothetical protein [Vulcanimicrobium alpinum]
MDIDEARRKSKSITRNSFTRFAVGEVPDRNDPAVRDGDIGGVRRITGAVVDSGALEDRPEQRLT